METPLVAVLGFFRVLYGYATGGHVPIHLHFSNKKRKKAFFWLPGYKEERHRSIDRT